MPFWTPRSTEEADLARAIGRLEGKVDLFLKKIDEADQARQAHESRISALERDLTSIRAYALAGSIVISGAVPIALKYFGLA